MPDVLVKDPTGYEFYASTEDVAANPDLEILPGQQLDVDVAQIEGTDIQGQVQSLPAEQVIERERTRIGQTAISAERSAEESRQQRLEEQYGGFWSGALTFKEGAENALSFGLRDLVYNQLLDEDELTETRERREARSGTYLAGEIGGEIAAAVATGGVSLGVKGAAKGAQIVGARLLTREAEEFGLKQLAKRAVGTGARALEMTPRGLVNRAVGRYVARGGTKLGKVARAAIGEGLETAAESAGNYIAQQTLQENPNFSAEALLAETTKGFLLGGAIGGGLEGLAGIGSKILSETPIPEKSLKKAIVKETETILPTIAKKPKSRLVKYSDVVSESIKKQTPEQIGILGKKLDDISLSRPDLAKKLSDGIDSDSFIKKMGTNQGQARDNLNKMLAEQEKAINEAKDWYTRYTNSLGIDSPNIDPAKLKNVDPELAAEGADKLAKLDDINIKLNAVQKDLEEVTIPDPSSLVKEAARDPNIPESSFGKVSEVAQNVVGAAETARDLGVDVPLPSVRQIPVVGDLISTYLKFKTGYRALRGGLLARTKAIDSAEKVVGVEARLANLVTTKTRTVAQKILSGPVHKPGDFIANRINDIQNMDSEQAALQVQITNDGAPLPVIQQASETARRAVKYLQSKTPKNPMAGNAWADKYWKPSESDQMDFITRWETVQNPLQAIENIMSGQSYGILEAEALQVVYPNIYSAYRENLISNSQSLVDSLPEYLRQGIGQAFNVPLVLNQIPGYLPISHPVAAAQQQSQVKAQTPRTSTVSPLTTLEATGEQARNKQRR